MDKTASTKRPSRWLLLLTFALAGILLYLALRKVDWRELVTTLSHGNLALLGLAVMLLSISCLARGLRWRVLLSTEKTLPVLTVFWATMTGYLGNAYLPARAGEVVRSVLIGQRGGISKSFALATALTERIVDAALLVAVSALALTMLGALPPELMKVLRGMAVLGLAGAALVFIAPHISGLLLRIIDRLPFSVNLRKKLSDFTNNFLTGACALQNWRRLGLFLLFSGAIWSLDTLCALTVSRAFGLHLNPAEVFILLAALGLASALPSTPGYVGVYQFVAVTVLAPFGLNESQALAYIIAYQGVMYVVITLWGLIGLWKLRGVLRL